MKAIGLARGGSLDNAVVLDDAQVLNPDDLRHADEFARHKVLDALGDLKLAGISIQASIRSHCVGDMICTASWLAQIYPNNYEIVEILPKVKKTAARTENQRIPIAARVRMA